MTTLAEKYPEVIAEFDAIKAKWQAEQDAIKVEREKRDADYLAQLAAVTASKPGWKSSEFWIAFLPTVSGLVMSLAEAFGAKPEHLDIAQHVVTGVTGAATGLAEGAASGDWQSGVTNAAMALVPSTLYILKRTVPKTR